MNVSKKKERKLIVPSFSKVCRQYIFGYPSESYKDLTSRSNPFCSRNPNLPYSLLFAHLFSSSLAEDQIQIQSFPLKGLVGSVAQWPSLGETCQSYKCEVPPGASSMSSRVSVSHVLLLDYDSMKVSHLRSNSVSPEFFIINNRHTHS